MPKKPPNSSLFKEGPTNFKLSDLISAALKSENIVVRPNLLFFERDFFVRLRNNQLWNSWDRAAENIRFFLQMDRYHVTLVIRLFFCNNWHWLSMWRLSIFHNGNLISIKFFPHAHGKGPDFFCDKGQYLQILRCLGWRPWRQTDIVNMQAFWGYVPPEPRLGEGAGGGGYDSTKNLSTLSAIFTNLFWKGFSKGRSF